VTPFQGCPSNPGYVAIPKLFFSDLLPSIQDSGELAVSLHLFRLLGARKGYPRALAERELLADRALNSGFSQAGRDPASEIARGLDLAVARGTFLRAVTPGGDAWVLLHTGQDRRAAVAIAAGRLPLSPGVAISGPPVPLPVRDIFTLYEQIVGVLSPLMAERLQEAEREYPATWVEEAFGAAEEQNKRSWAYIEAILKRWKTEGKDDGKRGGRPETNRVDYSGWLPASRRTRPS
jgi:DNA replication protein